MSPPGRPKGEFRSAQHEGTPVSPPGRPKGEFRSAQHEGTPVRRPPGGKGVICGIDFRRTVAKNVTGCTKAFILVYRIP